MARRLPAIRPGATQRLCHRRAPRGAAPARSLAAASQLFCPRPRIPLLGCQRRADAAAALNLRLGRTFRRKSLSQPLRLVFAGKFPPPHGDNCLLTTLSTFVDLPFSGLLAYQHGVAAPPTSAGLLRRTSRTFYHGRLVCIADAAFHVPVFAWPITKANSLKPHKSS